MPALAALILIAQASTATVGPALPPPPMHRDGSQQTFIAPSGEPFHAPHGDPYPVALWFAQADANHDGKITQREFTADFLNFFNRLDVNHDGIIDAAEITRYENEIVPETHSGDPGGARWSGASEGGEGGEGGEDGGSKPSGPVQIVDGAGRYDLLALPESITAMDTTLRGHISRQQVIDAADLRFTALDGDQRGYLTLDRLPQTWVQSHHGGGGKGKGRGNWHGGRGGRHGGGFGGHGDGDGGRD
ncbi:MAG: EF-hand domain-containing protein [Proteobacteria bacterium]|nr:EF-hand domain-containing protein [Pseudomonadota bacterium]MDE2411008.1 EF-hand domain-containing protein [Sphingomonadales bacterium]